MVIRYINNAEKLKDNLYTWDDARVTYIRDTTNGIVFGRELRDSFIKKEIEKQNPIFTIEEFIDLYLDNKNNMPPSSKFYIPKEWCEIHFKLKDYPYFHNFKITIFKQKVDKLSFNVKEIVVEVLN